MNFLSIVFLLILLFGLFQIIKRCDDKQEQLVFSYALFLKVIGAVGVGVLYQSYYSGGDTFNYLHDLQLMSHHATDGYFFLNQPRAWFFVQLIYPLYLLSFSDYWVLGVNLSVLSFLSTWSLYQEIKLLNIRKWTIQTAFFFIPSVVFWTSGLMKETVSFAVINLLFLVLLQVRRRTPFLGLELLVFCGLSVLLFYLKYYLFAPLFVLSMLFFTSLFQKYFSPKRLIMLLVFVLCSVTLATSILHPNMNFGFFLQALLTNHQEVYAASSPQGQITMFYDGSLWSFFKSAPLALFTGLFRPMIFEGWHVLSILVGIENTVVFVLFIIGMWGQFNKPILNYRSLIVMSVLFIAFLAIILPIASPNYGSLTRYRTAYYPFFVLLILQRVYLKSSSYGKPFG